jgi:hypothetical protein
MNKPFPVSLALLPALLFAGSALAQAMVSPNPAGVDADRSDRRCSSTALSADALAPCSDDVRNDGPRVSPIVVHPSSNGMVGSANTSAESSGNPMGTTGMPSTGSPNSGTSSMQGATGTGTAAAGGASRGTARR